MRGVIVVVLLASCSFKHGMLGGDQADAGGDVIDAVDAAPPRYWKAVAAGDEYDPSQRRW